MDGNIVIQSVNAVHGSKKFIVKAVADTFVSYNKIKEIKKKICKRDRI